MRAIIERYPNICLYLHGHTHRHTIADLQPNGLPIVLDSGCPIQKPHGTWNLIDLGEKECQVQCYRWSGFAWEGEERKSFPWRDRGAVV